MRIADTSAIIALFSALDAHHTKAKQAFADPDPILVPTEILVECIHIISRRAGRTAGVRVLQELLALPNVRPSEGVPFEGVRASFEQSDGRLSLADCFVVQSCIAFGAAPITFDKALKRAATRP